MLFRSPVDMPTGQQANRQHANRPTNQQANNVRPKKQDTRKRQHANMPTGQQAQAKRQEANTPTGQQTNRPQAKILLQLPPRPSTSRNHNLTLPQSLRTLPSLHHILPMLLPHYILPLQDQRPMLSNIPYPSIFLH